MFLGIEIGGTKLQLGVGRGDGSELVGFERRDIEIDRGARGILAQIDEAAAKLLHRHEIERIGVGFGGPVDSPAGCVLKSHQVDGWDGFPMGHWCQQTLGQPAILGNDCDCAALAEAKFGAGQGKRVVFFVTVGTGIGGGLVIDGQLHGTGRPAVAEIGHLRPGLEATEVNCTVESLAAGPGIVHTTGRLLECSEDATAKHELLALVGSDPSRLTAKQVAEAADSGNSIARASLDSAIDALGWAIAQVITITAAEVVVVGGGVALVGEEQFFRPLRRQVARYVFPPLGESYQVVPAALGESVVVHGALALAAG